MKNPWHGHTPSDQQDWLAWLLVSDYGMTDATYGHGWNPYTGAQRLSGGSGDDDHWLDAVQTSSIAVVWEYRDTAGNTVNVLVQRSALIPYVVKDGKGKYSLDHLLLGYVPEGASGSATGAGGWGGAPHPNRPLEALGYLITQDLNPAGASARYIANWYTSANAIHDPQLGGAAYARPRNWAFRRAEYNVEKSVLVPSAKDLGSGNYARADFLIGFVGGGAI
jgi:hypothetical protein